MRAHFDLRGTHLSCRICSAFSLFQFRDGLRNQTLAVLLKPPNQGLRRRRSRVVTGAPLDDFKEHRNEVDAFVGESIGVLGAPIRALPFFDDPKMFEAL